MQQPADRFIRVGRKIDELEALDLRMQRLPIARLRHHRHDPAILGIARVAHGQLDFLAHPVGAKRVRGQDDEKRIAAL